MITLLVLEDDKRYKAVLSRLRELLEAESYRESDIQEVTFGDIFTYIDRLSFSLSKTHCIIKTKSKQSRYIRVKLNKEQECH